MKSLIDGFRLDNKVVLITGGGQGIGRSFAKTLGEAGASIAIADIDLQLTENVANELSVQGIDAMAIEVDVTQKNQVKAMVQKVLDRWGQLTIAINSAGLGGWENAETLSESQWDMILDVNLKGLFFCCQEEAQVMFRQGYGKIINMSSVSAFVVLRPQNQAAYNVSKAGVSHLTRTLACEWAKRGIRINSLSPGYTRTEMLDKLLQTEEGLKMLPHWIEMTPLGRLAELSDLQGAILFLSSNLSDFMTGQDFIIDGGYSLW